MHISGDRRYGKTTLCRLVQDTLAYMGADVVYVSAELSSPSDLVNALAAEFEAANSRLATAARQWKLTKISAGGASFERTAPRHDLESLIADAMHGRSDKRLIIILDEITVLAMKMEHAETGSGDNLLHTLRRLRERYEGRLAMVLLGSVGFHHIAKDSLGTTNDLVGIAVGSIDRTSATCMARCLLLGEGVATDDEEAVGDAIALAAEGVPYYVQVLVKYARDSGAVVSATNVPRLVEAAIRDPLDDLHLRHYLDRIPTYYGREKANLVGAVLDAFAAASAGITPAEVSRALTTANLARRPSIEQLVELIQLLEADHYLVRNGNARAFASELVRAGWKYHRG